MNWLGWALLSAVFAAATAILAKVGVAGVDSNLATAIRTTVVLLFSWLLVFLVPGESSRAAISSRAWWFLVGSGMTTGLSWLCYFRALQLGPASKVAPVDKLSLVLVILGAATFLQESISVKTALATAMIVSGVILLSVD